MTNASLPRTEPYAVLDLDRPLRLYPLTFLVEGDEVTVGRADVDSYCVLPADGAAALRQLAEGRTPRNVATWYEQTYGDRVDVVEFLAALAELEFVVPDGTELTTSDISTVRWQRLGQAVFSWPAWMLYCAAFVATIVVTAGDPRVAPRYRNLFFTHYMTVLELALFVGQFPLIMLHELCHVLAGRRLGIRSRLSVGRRLYYIVFETALDGLATVPRRQRYLPILAGVLCDVIVFCTLTLTAAALSGQSGAAGTVAEICLAMAFATLLRIAWQGYFYLRTDLYQLIVTVLGCINLHDAARALLANRVNQLFGRHERLVDETLLHPVDRRAARWYSWLVVMGYAFSLGTFVIAFVPTAHRVLSTVFGRLVSSHAGAAGLVDSLGFLFVNLAQLMLLVALAVRQRRRARRAAPAVHILA